MNKTIEISTAYTRKMSIHALPNIEIKRKTARSKQRY